ncbi:MAG TPA: hypothetical protein VMY35_05760 [Phycisphaerae bacterium]|nr:hypothetical protein [Phycisphaerae bacterium]
MKDFWHEITSKLLDHSRYTIIGTVLGLMLAGGFLGFAGCQSRTYGLFGEKVTRVELAKEVIRADTDLAGKRADILAATAVLNAEVAERNQLAAAASEDLDRQDALKVELVNAVSLVGTQLASGSPVNWVGLIPMATTLLLGAAVGGIGVDNVRKGKLLNNGGTPPPAEPTA